MSNQQQTALITGASRGFGRALATELANRGWQLLINARSPEPLLAVQQELNRYTTVEAISGDVRDEILLLQLADRLRERNWSLDLVVNNASLLGPSPMPPLLSTPVEALHSVFHANTLAPLSLLQKLLPYLQAQPVILNLSSDAATSAYSHWGNYGASKAALDHWSAVLAVEKPDWFVYAFDPGDMRTQMHQDAFPGADISDRPLPQEVALPAALRLLDERPPSGRFQANQLLAPSAVS